MAFLSLEPQRSLYGKIIINLTLRRVQMEPNGPELHTYKSLFGSFLSFIWGPPGAPSGTPGGPRTPL